MAKDIEAERIKNAQANAAQAKLNKEEQAGYERALAKEKEENEAPRKAVSDAVGKAVDFVKEKAADVGKGMRNYGRAYKQGLGMQPETPYEKKKGGVIRSASSRADGCAIRGKTRA